jgi:hypothetical protein
MRIGHRPDTNGDAKLISNGSFASRTPPFSQALSSVLNHPPQTSVVYSLLSGDYQAIWESPQRLLGFSADSTWTPPPLPPLPPGYPTITLDDFKQYLADMSTLMAKFEAIHPIAQGDGTIDERIKGPDASDNLNQELKEVPEVFFKEGFNLEEPETFELSGASSEGLKSKMMQERLSHYLDVVEQQLMRQIQARSDSFYKALDTLQELYAEVDVTLRAIVEFRAVIRRLDENLVGHALRVAQVQARGRSQHHPAPDPDCIHIRRFLHTVSAISWKRNRLSSLLSGRSLPVPARATSPRKRVCALMPRPSPPRRS